VIPLATLLGLADRPGESHGFGPLDPGLCRSLSAIAANSARTTLCITVTDASGIAVAHGCTRPARRRPGQPPGRPASRPLPLPRALAALPARINLTIPASRLPALARPPGRDPHPAAHLAPPAGSRRGAGGPPHAAQPGDWQFARLAGPPSPGGPDDDVWLLTLPDGTVRTTRLSPLPAEDCDHRYESFGYQPSDTLRHLVQVRDYECTFPACSRHARESDFEHAVPYHEGGRTCACNAGARSRQCHRVKQSPGWTVTQPRPGWHHWTTPAGRCYAQGPKRYPS
jgi:hypothetical protein